MSSIMTGTSESYVGGFAVALGHKDLHLALLATVPLVCGAVAQLCARALVDLVGSRKRFVVLVAALQAAVHALLVVIAATGTRALLPLLCVNIAYWTCGMAVVPAWNAWMGSLTSEIDRGRYFALRSALSQVGLLAAFVAGGYAMEAGRASGSVLFAFGAVCTVAGLARGTGAALMGWQHDPGEGPGDNDDERAPLVARLREAARASTWRTAAFVVAFQLSANVAIPFFAPYMLNVLHLDFVQFMSVYAIAVVVKAIALPLWGRIAARIGWRAVLTLGALGTATVALGWAFVHTLPGLVGIQAISGMSWAAIELSGFQLLLLSSTAKHRVSFFALSTSLTACGQVTGSLLGSGLLALVGGSYPTAFLASGILRAASVLVLHTARRREYTPPPCASPSSS